MIADSYLCEECGHPIDVVEGVCLSCDVEMLDIGCGNLSIADEGEDEDGDEEGSDY